MTDIAFQTRHVYLNESDFYHDGVLGEVRKHSREMDFGVWWRSTNRPHPVFRVTYVMDSHEVIAVCVGGQPAGQVTVLASGVPEDDVEDILAGWQYACGEDESLGWAQNALRDYPPRLDG